MKAMILAAGLGTRLKPFTNSHPKALAPVNSKTVLQRNIEYLRSYGITEVIINVHHFAEQIIEAVEKNKGWGSKITISDESDELLETGGGVKKAAWFLQHDDEALVINSDVLSNLPLNEMMDYHRKFKPLVTLATTSRPSSRFFLFDRDAKLTGWRNEKTNETKGESGVPRAFSGIQMLSKEFFDVIPFSGKFSLIDVYLDLCTKYSILSFNHNHSKFVDIGTVEKLAKAAAIFRP